MLFWDWTLLVYNYLLRVINQKDESVYNYVTPRDSLTYDLRWLKKYIQMSSKLLKISKESRFQVSLATGAAPPRHRGSIIQRDRMIVELKH